MRVLVAFCSCFLFILSSLQAQRIPKVKPLIVKATSTECNVCGMRFWDEFKELKQTYKDEAIVMAVHPLELSQLHNATSEEYVENLSVFWGTPTLYLNGEMAQGYWLKEAKDFIEEVQKKQVVALPFVNYTINENTLNVSVKTQFLKEKSRAHYLAVYVLEDDVKADQSNRGPEDLHSKILRTHLGDGVMGTLFSEEDIAVNQEFKHDFSVEIDPSWVTENLEIAVVIYEKNGNKFTVVNGETATSPSLSTSVNILEAANIKLTANPNLIEGVSTIQLDLTESLEDLNLTVFNTLGQTTHSIFSGDLPNGVHNFPLNRTDLASSGTYFLVLEKDGSTLVEKLIVK